MKKIIYISPVIFIFLFSLCKPQEEKLTKIMENGVEVIVNHLEPYPVKNALRKMMLKKELSIDTEKFKDENITSIASIEADLEGNIYILDRKLKKIVKFDNKGYFLGTIGREGQGPGEFRLPLNLRINSVGEIVVYDSLNHKFSFFQRDGSLIKEIKINLGGILNGIPLENGNYLFDEVPRPKDMKADNLEGVLSLFDSGFKKIKELDTIEMSNPLAKKIKGTYHNLAYSIEGNKIFIANQEQGYEINVFDLNGNLLKKIRKEYRKLTPSEEYKKEFINFLKITPGIYNFVKDRLYFPDVLPPFHYFLTDDEGRIFVQTYEAGENKGEYMFDIFNSNGVFIANKSLNDFSRPNGLNGRFKNSHFYCVYEKEGGFHKIVSYKVIWKK
ncbi:MAG: 6-bladed beta-propeller [Candidatus Hydrothermarchaeota archaeon]